MRFVLVHGAWHGLWCWREVAAALRADGHEVSAPTLSGSAERRVMEIETGHDAMITQPAGLAALLAA